MTQNVKLYALVNTDGALTAIEPALVKAPKSGSAASKDVAAYHVALAAATAAQAVDSKKSTDATRAALAAAITATRDAAIKAKSNVKFLPGDAGTWRKWTVEADVAETFARAADADERMAMMATLGQSSDGSSPVAATIFQAEYVRADVLDFVGGSIADAHAEYMARLAAGFVILPTTGKGAAAKSAKPSIAERAAATAAEIFGAIPSAE